MTQDHDAMKRALLKSAASKRKEKAETIIANLLAVVRYNRDFDALFAATVALLSEAGREGESAQFAPSAALLDALRDEFFAALSPLSAFEHATKLGALIGNRASSGNATALAGAVALLHHLVFATPLMSAVRLREWVRTELVTIYGVVAAAAAPIASLRDEQRRLWRGASALLAISVYATLAMELSYSPRGVDETLADASRAVWAKVVECTDDDDGNGETTAAAVVVVCTFLLRVATTGDNDDARRAAKSAKKVAKALSALNIKHDNNSESVSGGYVHLDCEYVLMDFLMWNFSTLCLAAPSSSSAAADGANAFLRPLVDFVVTRCATFARLDAFLAQYSRLVNLRYSPRAVDVQAHLADRLAQLSSARDDAGGGVEFIDEAAMNYAPDEQAIASNGTTLSHNGTTAAKSSNGKLDAVKNLRKRKLNDDDGDEGRGGAAKLRGETTAAAPRDGGEENGEDNIRQQQQQQLSAFDGHSLLLLSSSAAAGDERAAKASRGQNCLLQIRLQKSSQAPDAVAARKQLKSVKKLCQKVCQLFAAVTTAPAAKASRLQPHHQEHEGGDDGGDWAATARANAALNARKSALHSLLKLSTALAACKLPRNVVTPLLESVRSSELSEIMATLFDGALSADIRANVCALFYVLRHFVKVRGDFRVDLVDARLVALMVNGDEAEEQDAKGARRVHTNALKLVAAVLHKNRAELTNAQVAPIISLCMALCRPVAFRFNFGGDASEDAETNDDDAMETTDLKVVNDDEDDDDGEEGEAVDTTHAFLLAELAFLTAALRKFPTAVGAQSATFMGILPDFFQQLTHYRERNWHAKAEKLEQMLATLCATIRHDAKAFHKAIPFAMSNWLGMEARELSFPMYQLLAACDKFDLALLATNLRPREKRKFAVLQQQFYRLNKIIG